MAKITTAPDSVVVIGLGRFGGQVAQSLIRLGHEVLGIDENPQIVAHWADDLTHVAQADSTDDEALHQLGVGEFGRAIVGIGSKVEASVLTVVALAEIGVPEIWAKAVSTKHGKILSAVGAQHVIFPEAAMGERVAHLITSRMLDFIELDDGFAIAKVRVPAASVGKTLDQAALQGRYGVTIVGIKVLGEDFYHATADTVIPPQAILIVSGRTIDVERFASLT